ncbi:MAG TPA: adenosylcobalamin-dependent ribonucleoside-diphosphate reductase, partial [Thiotrichales bacterium]|nr:adenosylcobalamin-dependent ribonucleoside-diphosphate reductase [Thiotrichales bacterium]
MPLQPASEDIWQRKYQLKNNSGEAIDLCVEGTFTRIARALADIEQTPEKQQHWFEKFLWALKHGAIPAGRIISNAGAQAHKPATSTINCTVSGAIADSMDDILQKVHEAGLTLKSGAGIGYEFSTLRPNDAYVSGSGALTSGPLSFMDIYDKVCFTISSAGGRRGAQMATFDVGHPDVLDFIRAKREDGRLRQFNLSLLITREFMEAVKNDAPWPLAFPLTREELESRHLDLNDPDKVIWRDWPVKDAARAGYLVNEEGAVACRIYRTIDAGKLWNVIMASTYDYAEPGFILIDQYNEMNNNWFCENIRTTNPCGEQGLPEYGACLLGSINLTRLVKYPFTDKACFDWDTYREVVNVFTRMLDNVVEINGLPLAQQREEIKSKRRHGMGYLGLGSALTMLGMRYGSEASLAFTEKVTRELALGGWQCALELAKEKGAAPVLEQTFSVTSTMLHRRPEMKADGWQVGDKIKGKVLHAKYSRYMQQLATVAPALVDELAETGARFTHHSSIA